MTRNHLTLKEPRKALVARLLREHTTAGGRWVAQRLALGHPGGVGRIADRVPADPKLAKAYQKLNKMLKCED